MVTPSKISTYSPIIREGMPIVNFHNERKFSRYYTRKTSQMFLIMI